MKSNKEKITSLVLIDLEPGLIVTEEMIRNKVEFFSIMYSLTEEETTEVVNSLQTKLSIRMDRGVCVKEKYHKSWYYTAKKDHNSGFWDRYRKYLSKDVGFNADVINALDKTTDEMMDMLGNPSSEESFSRRGLVIGDVQSGKTATYTALINKAADDGYRIIILLTGTIEKLRRQTQGRLDEGFVGLDSTAFIRDKNNIWVGVGNIDPSISGWAITSTSSDFNTSTAAKLSGRISGISEPVLFVLKKNKSVLEKLEQWLRIYNASPVDNKIHLPMLLIDDEADNASVNTKKAEDEPTTINAGIRKLLKLFVRTNYVGFTATPFANIFINPDSETEMLEDDLFPKDFIYALEAPTNYVGARGVFLEDGKYAYMLKSNDDCEFYIPEKHKKEFVPTALPKSMKEAIASFFIANAVRDLRGHKTKHRSMLINVSRFIAVQDSIAIAVDGYVREMQREVKNYYNTGSEALKYESFLFIKSVYSKHFAEIPGFEYNWDEIQKALHDGIASVVVRTVNGGNAPKNLNYDEHEDEGLRLIAIGGYSLSRGLTLEGLCVSYFFRNSKMYDTLMQMGRWFGYREGYVDICQIWMAEEAIDWYNYISLASDELRREVRRMRDANLTPRDFGLSVRSDINALLVTARNKMRTAKNHTIMVSLNGRVVETPYIHIDKVTNQNNLMLTEKWIANLKSEGYILEKHSDYSIKNYQILNVPRKYINEFIDSFNSHYLNMDFQTEQLVNLISSYNDGTLDLWDIIIAEGNGRSDQFCGKEIRYVTRRFGIKKESKALQFSGKGSRLGSANFAKGGLTKEQVFEIEEKERLLQKQLGEKHGFSQELYFNSGIKRNPLLVIYPVELSAKAKDINNDDRIDPKRMEYINGIQRPVIGLSLGIPRINGKQSKTYQYKINLVKFKELLGVDDEYEEIDETIDED